MITRTITLEMHGAGEWTVREGDRYIDRLCWDEMLGSVAELTHPALGKARYAMPDTAEHVQRHRMHEERMAALEAKREAEARGAAVDDDSIF